MVDLGSDDYVIRHINASIDVKRAILKDHALLYRIVEAARLCVEALQRGNKVMIAGNGGSAADAQHISAELVGRYNYHRPGMPAIALTTDTSAITSISNDYGFECVFERQLQALAGSGDVFIGISTSGNSQNIRLALKSASAMELKTIGLTGGDGGSMREECEICINVPSNRTPEIQESHIMIGHILCAMIEESMFPDEKPRSG